MQVSSCYPRSPMNDRMRFHSGARSQHGVWFVLGQLIALTSCSEPISPRNPSIDSDAAANDALAMFDANDDGVLDSDELSKSPGLFDGADRADANGDGKISSDEIATRIGVWTESPRRLISTSLAFTHRRRPLVGATITLEPEPFLDAWLPTVQGKTDSMGQYAPVVSREFPGVPAGYYRIKASLQQRGKERLPAEVNEESQIGVEMCADRGFSDDVFEIRFDVAARR